MSIRGSGSPTRHSTLDCPISPDDSRLVVKLRTTLFNVRWLAGERFSGTGLVVHTTDANLPVFPLRVNTVVPCEVGVDSSLATMSQATHDLHDGFHLISLDWRLTRVAQYFSPPILWTAPVNRARRFGGRYIAALFGSALPGVVLCGVASADFGIAIFKGGEEVFFEEFQ